MEMTYNYFRQLYRFVTENYNKEVDIIFWPQIEVTDCVEYPTDDRNITLVFHRNLNGYISDSSPCVSFQDVIELWNEIGLEVDRGLFPYKYTTCKYFVINGKYFLCCNDFIEVWEEEQVKIEVLQLEGAKSINITTPKFRG